MITGNVLQVPLIGDVIFKCARTDLFAMKAYFWEKTHKNTVKILFLLFC